MQQKEKSIVKVIKDFHFEDLDTVNLVYGKENFLKKQLIEKIKDQTETNFHFFWGDELTLEKLNEVFAGSSLFSEGEIAVIWDFDQFLSKLGKTQIQQFMELVEKLNLPNRLILVSLKEKIPKKEPYKTILEKAQIFTAPSISSKAFMVSVKKKIEREGIEIDDDTLLYLLSKLKNDLYYAKQEVEKLIILTKTKGKITKEDVDAVVFPKVEENVFSFIDKFIKREKDALKIFKDLVSTTHHPFEIQSLILTYLNRILLFKTLREQGIGEDMIFSKLGVNHPFMKTTLKKLAGFVEKEEIITLIKELYNLEIKQKVYFEDPYKSSEEFVVKWLS